MIGTTNQTDADRLESLAAKFLISQVHEGLDQLFCNVSDVIGDDCHYADALIKLALFMYKTRHDDSTENRLRFRGQATRVLTTWVYDRLPIEALKNLAKYDPKIYEQLIEVRYAEIDATRFLQPPDDYQAP